MQEGTNGWLFPDGYMIEESVAVGENPCCKGKPYLLLVSDTNLHYACCCTCGKSLTKEYLNADDAMDEFEGLI